MKRYINKYRHLKRVVVEQEEEHEQKEEMKKIMSSMKQKIQEANRIEEKLEESLREKQLICEKMEAELIHLRKELDTKFVKKKYENSSKILDEIITAQRNPSNKNGLGYSKKENQVGPKSYATALRSTVKKEEEEKIRNDYNSRRPLPPIKKELKTTPKKIYQNRKKKIRNAHAPTLDTNM